MPVLNEPEMRLPAVSSSTGGGAALHCRTLGCISAVAELCARLLVLLRQLVRLLAFRLAAILAYLSPRSGLISVTLQDSSFARLCVCLLQVEYLTVTRPR